MTGKVENMRIHFYGVQGSASIFPPRVEREAARLRADLRLLEQVFNKLHNQQNTDGKLACSVENFLGGPLNKATLANFRSTLELQEQAVYGGWTTCFRIETSDGHDLVFDCGSGFRICAEDIMRKWGNQDERHLTIFGSHAHYDHTEGFDQAAVCFDPRNNIHVVANYHYLKALDQNLGIFSHEMGMDLKGIQTPLSYDLMPASFTSTEIRNFATSPPPAAGDPMIGEYHDLNKPFIIGKTIIQPFEVFHPDPCLGFRIEHNGKVFVYATDHELRHGDDPKHPLQKASLEAEQRLIEQTMNADVLYRDGQFLRSEYDGDKGIGTPLGVSRMDWGHSCIEDVVAMAKHCNVGHTYIGHHDPNRTWAEKKSIDEKLRLQADADDIKYEIARAETIIEL